MSTLEEKIAGAIRLLGSDKDGDVIAAVGGLKRVLASAGTDLHDLAAGIEKLGKMNSSGLSKAEMEKVFSAGYAKGVENTENKLHGIDEFSSADGKPAWEAVALYCQRNKDRLATKHHEFIDDMASRTAWGREPTEKQHKYLHSLFFKLGGRIA
jgi:hypothetical protein